MKQKMKDSGVPWIGMIPSDWNVVRTKNVFACSKSLVGEDWSHTQLLSLTTKGIKEVAIGSTSGKVPDSYETYQVVNKDDLVMCLFDLDCSAVFSGVSNYHGMISPAYKVLKTLEGYYPAFYGYWFDYIFDGRKYKYLSKNIRYSLTYDEFAALGIAAPPLPTQQCIADFLDRKCAEIDELAALQETMIAELKRYKQSVITEAVTKGIRNEELGMRNYKPSGVEWIGEIPEGWNVCRLKDILKRPLQYGANESGIPFNEELPRYVRITDISDNNLRDDLIKQSLTEEQADGYILEHNDILFARSGGTVGKAFIYKQEYGRCAFAGYLIKAVIKKGDARFVYYYTQTHCYEEWKRRIFIQATIQNIGADRYSIMEMPVPPLAEQRAIADYLDRKCAEIDELIAIKQQKIEALKEYKKSVIFEYVTGKKEVEE